MTHQFQGILIKNMEIFTTPTIYLLEQYLTTEED
jgi:hypothetical protein